MFILSRLIGVSVFAYFLVMFCLLIARTKIDLRGLMACYTAVLAVMGFFYEPYITADLYRIREMMVSFGAMELPAFWRTYVVTSAVPVARMLYWSIGKTGVLGLLPAAAAAVSYGCIFYVLGSAARRFGSSRMDTAITMLFIMSVGQYMSAVSNIRTMMAVSLVCFCVYRETVEKKRSILHLLLYAAAAGLHTVAVPVIAMRMALPVFSRKWKLWQRTAFLLLLGIAAAAVLSVVPNVASELLEKVNDYIFGDRYSYIWEYLIGFIAMAVEFYALDCLRRRRDRAGDLADISRLLALCLITAAALCFEFSIFHRLTTYIAPTLAAPLLLLVLRGDGEQSVRRVNRRTVLIVVSLGLLALSCSRGSLCSFKFY